MARPQSMARPQPIVVRHVLCPVDFSESSRRALHYALDLARRRGARVTALHVGARTLPPLSTLAAGASGAMEGGAEVRGGLRQDLLEELKLFAEPAAQGVALTCEVREGNIVTTIVDVAAQADVLVLGTHGRDEFEKLVLGSVAEKVLHKAPCPVLAVPRPDVAPPPRPFKHILCPMDFTPASEEALAHAVALAREEDGKVTLLHVVEGLLGERSNDDLHLDLGGYLARAEEDARERFGRLRSGPDGRWFDEAPIVAVGKAHAKILETAQARGADRIVLGVHGRGVLE
ncbi:MAG TPA: universal stress protein, partial [Vicinamibacteria bacterium]|nr:universal stress protein [Vicinamibacteria bacterium]